MRVKLLCTTVAAMLIASCMSTGGVDEYDYYDAEEVIDAWEEAIVDEDVDQYASTFWPDARKTHIPREGEPIELVGREEIAAQQTEYNRSFDFEEYDVPDYELEEDRVSGTATVVYRHENLGLVETLKISRRGDSWGIEAQLIEPVEGRAAAQGAPGGSAGGTLDGRRVAVVGIESVTGAVTDETVRGMLLFIENEFVNSGRVKVVDRQSVEKIIDEYSFQTAGLTDQETAAEIGKLAGAEIIVTGSLSTVGSVFYLQLRLIDVETAEVVASSLGEARSEREFLEMSEAAVRRLF